MTPAKCQHSIIVGGQRGMVPGLGDAACYAVLDEFGADVQVRKGDLKLFVTVEIPGTTSEAAIRLARLVTSRI